MTIGDEGVFHLRNLAIQLDDMADAEWAGHVERVEPDDTATAVLKTTGPLGPVTRTTDERPDHPSSRARGRLQGPLGVEAIRGWMGRREGKVEGITTAPRLP